MTAINGTQVPFRFSFEEVDDLFWMELVRANWKLVGYIGISYVLAIFALQRLMRDRAPFQLKWPLFCWNASLSVFAIFGFVRTLPGFLDILGRGNGLYESVCTASLLNVPIACWTLMFSLSKFWELGDTLFIVLRKKPLIFLQWYHHVVTMTVTWIVAPFLEPVVRWYIVLNFGVHSLMYPYFALRGLGKQVPSWVAYLILTLEIAQMIIGFSVNMLSMYYQKLGYPCVRHPLSIQLFGLLYGSFLLLFGKLFYDYIFEKRRRKNGKLETKMD